MRMLPLVAALFPAMVVVLTPATATRAEELAASASAREAAAAVLDMLGGDDADLRALALDHVRYGLRGTWFTRELAALLPRQTPAEQPALLRALADRGDAAAAAAARPLAKAGDAAVWVAAISLLGRLGDAADVAVLVSGMADGGQIQAAARRGLLEIHGPEAEEALRAAAAAAGPAHQAALIDILTERRDRASLPLFVAAADGDPAVRPAAMRALAQFGAAAEIDAMARSYLRASGDERRAAEQAIVTVCTSGAQAPAAATALVKRFTASDQATQDSLLPVLARVGGPEVMAIIDGMLASPAARQRGLAALVRWPDAAVKERLLALHAETGDPAEKQVVLNALIRIAPLPDNKLDDSQRLSLLQQTLNLCERDADRARVIERANAIRTFEAFQFVVAALDDPALSEAACRSVVELAHHRKLRDAHKAEFVAALDRVLAATKNQELLERAVRYKGGKTWDRTQKN
jgi:rhodanese-related sulfurtransferase